MEIPKSFKKTIESRTSRILLGTIIFGAGLIVSPEMSNAQTEKNEAPPTPMPVIRSGSTDWMLPPALFTPAAPVNLQFFAGCELGSRVWAGKATHYYPNRGCVGCSENNLTAMGVPLDYIRRTIAFMQLPLGSKVKITNLDKGLSTDAEVNDRGGFENHGFIADLAPATKEAIGADDITQVRIQELNNCR